MIIKVNEWGNFDVKITASILYCETETCSLEQLVKQFIEEVVNEGYRFDATSESATVSGLSRSDIYPQKFIDWLLRRGFKYLKTKEVSFSN